MRQAAVYRNRELVGYLTEESRQHYSFRYDGNWLANGQKPAISLTLPKRQLPYESDHLFPFFANLLSEGANRHLQSTRLRIDENDSFGLLLATAQYDTIGAITIQPVPAP